MSPQGRLHLSLLLTGWENTLHLIILLQVAIGSTALHFQLLHCCNQSLFFFFLNQDLNRINSKRIHVYLCFFLIVSIHYLST